MFIKHLIVLTTFFIGINTDCWENAKLCYQNCRKSSQNCDHCQNIVKVCSQIDDSIINMLWFIKELFILNNIVYDY
jgi:hypothetical protein